ncbi:hypothetical protein B7463_g8859, partial [Scytalidium lignicola]
MPREGLPDVYGITNPNSDFIHDETDDDDLPPIEKVLNPETCYPIPIPDYNIGHCSQNHEKPVVNADESRIVSKQSKLDDGERFNNGTRVILENDDLNTSNYRVADTSADEPGHRYVDGDGRPIPQLQLDGSISTSILAQNSHYSRYRPPQLPQEQINPGNNDNTSPSISDDQTLESSCAHAEKKNEEDRERKHMNELERDMLLAFEELEKSSSATPEPSQLQPDQAQDQNSSADKTIDECEQRSALNKCHQKIEQSQEQRHQRQEEFFKATGTENQICEDVVSAGPIFHTDCVDQNREAADHDHHHARELQLRSESTGDQPVPTSEILAQCFRIRGIRTFRSADRQPGLTQYHVVWGKHLNRHSSWVKEGDVQLYIKMRVSPYHASKKLYEYLVDDSPHWVSECQLIISFCPTIFSNLIASSPHLSNQASPETDVTQSITLIKDSHCGNLQNSQILSGSPALSSLVLDHGPQPRKLVEKRMRPGSDETGSNSHLLITTEDSHDLCDVSSDEEPHPPKRRKQHPKSVAASQNRRSPQHDQGPAITAIQHRRRRTTIGLVDNGPTPSFEPASRASSPSAESEVTSSEESHAGTVTTDPDQEWEISHFVKMEIVDGERYFLTNWKETWLPESALEGAKKLVKKVLG